jgi:hypothetical protein
MASPPGPDQSSDNPIGVGGMDLHTWHLRADEMGNEDDIPSATLLLAPQ